MGKLFTPVLEVNTRFTDTLWGVLRLPLSRRARMVTQAWQLLRNHAP
ncbi:MAG: hypothetical protein JNL70_03940 [Saprospiraceae bacterium]|nr:hypothetical protein [Saprospiraceae bacterium]